MAAQHKSDLEDLFAAAKRALDEGRVRPPFLLVENAFVQIEAKPGPGRVTVTATVHENQLTITVTDDGGGDGGTVACLTLPMQSEEG